VPKLGEASVDIEVDLGKYRRQLREAEKITKRMTRRMVKSLDRVGKKLTSLGKSFGTRLSAPMILAGAAIGKVTSDFDLSLSRIVGLVGVAEDQVKDWREEILKLGPAVGKGPNELAEGLFFVTSAGFRGSKALDILRQSAKAASAGLGETKVVADAATSAINAFGEGNLDAGTAIGILVGTVREGKAEASAIAGVLGQVLPIAAELGVSFDQVGASIAAMTRLGLPAEESVTSLKATLSSLTKVTPDAEKAINGLGLEVKDLQADLKKPGGLLNVLKQLKEGVENTDVEMVRIFPNIRALTGVLGLVGKNAAITQSIFEALAKDGVETLDTAFAVVAKESGFKFSQAMVRVNNTMIRLGDVLLPVVVPLITDLTKAIDRAGKAFSELSSNTKTWIIIIAGAAIALGPLLITVGLLSIGLVVLIKTMAALATAAVIMSKVVVKALIAIVSIPGLIITAFIALATTLFVFKQTVTEIATGVFEAFKNALVTNFNDFIAVPFIELINKMFDFIPDKLKEALGITSITVPDIIGGSFVDDMSDVMKQAFATGTTEANAFADNVRDAISKLKNMFTLGGGVGPLAEMEEQFNRLKALIEDVGKKSEEAGKKSDAAWKTAAENSKEAVAASLEDMIVNFESLETVVQSLAATIRDELIRALVAKPIAGFIAGILGTAFGLPGLAGGGQVNGPTVVGERGPELFIPSGTGTIENNATSKSGMRGTVVNLVQNNTFAVDVKNSVRAEIINAAPLLSDMAAEKVFDVINRQAR